MKTRNGVLVLLALILAACDSPSRDGSSYYYPSSSQPSSGTGSAPRSKSIAEMAGSSGAPVPRGGYAPGSGPTAMPGGNQFMYQQNVSGPFGSSSSTGVINSFGGVQSYQTIGNMPVYPGMALPGNNYRRGAYGRMPTQPVYVPGVNGAPGYYLNPSTGQRVPGP